MAPSDYDVLLLDFGGVCLLNPVEMHARTEAVLGLPAGTFEWMGPVDPDTDWLGVAPDRPHDEPPDGRPPPNPGLPPPPPAGRRGDDGREVGSRPSMTCTVSRSPV